MSRRTHRLSTVWGMGERCRLLTTVCVFNVCARVAEDRYLDKTARQREGQKNLIDYMCRFDSKYVELNGTLDKYDGNPFT